MDNPLGDQRDWRAISTATGLGCSVVASLLICIGGGILLDEWLGTVPLFTLLGIALGLVAAGWTLYQLATVARPARSPRKRTPPASPTGDARDAGQSDGPNEEEP